jgi:signal transduction histidine kinase
VTGLLATLQWLVTVGFVLLGLVSLDDWRRHRGQRRAWLATAIGLLALVSLSGRVNAATGNHFAHLTTPFVLVLFMASGYALLMFRSTFIPVRPQTRLLILALAASATGFYLVVGPPAGVIHMSPVQAVALLALILIWSGMVGEPVVRFFLAAQGRPAVQRARLRALAAGFAAIVFILVIAGVGGARLNSVPAAQIGIQLIALAAIPLIFAGFAPPPWVMRAWREPEEEAFARAVRELLLFSPDRRVLAARALDWALRFVGTDAGAILEGDDVLAVRTLRPEQARELASQMGESPEPRLFAVGGENQNAVVIPLVLHSGSGRVVAVSNAFMPLFGSDEVARLEQFGTNITAGLDRVRITERMTELERNKSQFLNLASHELRTPLSVIRGYLSILETGSLGTLNAAGRKAIAVLSAKAMEMNMLIEQMLEAARLEEGRVVLRTEILDACRAAAAAVEVVRPLADDRHPLIVDCGAEPVQVNADPDRLATILVNLIDNAVKYSPKGGEVRCAVRAQDGHARISVRDHGVGLAESDLPHLFTKFGRVSTPETQHIAGTGLGLYLCRELARQQGGDISVESELGKGSTFTLSLPLALSAPAEEAAARQPVPLTVLKPTG